MIARRPRLLVVLSIAAAMSLGVPSVASAYDVPMVEQQLTTNNAAQYFADIYGTKVVYQDERNGNYDIYLYDLATGAEKRLTTNSAHQQDPAIYGTKVVYQDERNGNYDIYLYDLATGAEKRLTTDSAFQWAPAISGTKVVYYDNRSGNTNWDIYLYDLATSTEKRLTTNSGLQYNPAISGDKVVYQDYRNGNLDVYLYDLATSTEKRLTTNSSDQRYPAIYGDKVVYVDRRNGNYDIYLYDLTVNAEKRLTTDSLDQQYPGISGDRVVFADNRNGNSDIYLGELATPRISLSAPSVVGYGGKATLKGTLTSFTGIPIAGRAVWLEVSTDGVGWSQTSAKSTSSSGAFSLTSPSLYWARYLRVNFQGEDPLYLSAQSSARRVKPKVYVRTPIARSTMSRTKYYTVYGYLKPRHSAGSYPVRIYKWKKTSSGRWKRYGYVSAKAYDYSNYTKYLRKIRLPYSGRWRLRAYAPGDYWHTGTWSSGYDYVTVK